MSDGAPPRTSRAAPAAIPFDVATELCRVAERLSEQQEELPLLREAVEADSTRLDTMGKILQDLILEIRSLRQAVDQNSAAMSDGKVALVENTQEIRRGRGGGGP
ncbi:MAG: hypothetical protein ACREQ9_24825 [Candidatus Binatia bacterium]